MNPYFEQSILNAEPVELIRIIYQRAIVSVRDAREHLRNKRISERSAAVMKAYAAVAELLTALRLDVAPEVSIRLQDLYSYMLERLLAANAQQSDAALADVLGLLVTLSEAWSGVAAELTPKEAGNGWGQTGALPDDTRSVASTDFALTA